MQKTTAEINLFLLTTDECLDAVNKDVSFDNEWDWGWVATCCTGPSRDNSIINISKISGEKGPDRIVENHKMIELPANILPETFVEQVLSTCCSGAYPNITIAIDVNGFGHIVWNKLCSMLKKIKCRGVSVKAINWYEKPMTAQLRVKFNDLRALAHFYTAAAIRDGRVALDSSPKTIAQFILSPSFVNNTKQKEMLPLREMMQIDRIASVDRSDTYHFIQLISYTPARQR
jgi:hypothetical protein